MAVKFKACSVADCNGNAHYTGGGVKGWCRAHYVRDYRYGDPVAGLGRHEPQGALCIVPGCDRQPRAKQLCLAHYERMKNHGDPLSGGTHVGAPLEWLVEHIRHAGDECLIWPFARFPDGNGQVRFRGRSQKASRVMCILAHGEPAGPRLEAAHSCGKGHEACVSQRHLRWDTPKGNCADKIIHGTHNRGERNYAAKLTEGDVIRIRALSGRLHQRQIAEMFGVSRMTVSDIFLRRTWAWL